jgi:hypothetical protein
MTRRSSTSQVISASPDLAFAVLIDLDRLPEWNAIMTRVVDRPSTLASGAEWVVEFSAMGQTWRSGSRVEELDSAARVFAYRSGTDDGNPSYAIWRWRVEPAPGGARVMVSWDLHPETFWRKLLLVRIRSRQLRREVPASIESLGRAALGIGG